MGKNLYGAYLENLDMAQIKSKVFMTSATKTRNPNLCAQS